MVGASGTYLCGRWRPILCPGAGREMSTGTRSASQGRLAFDRIPCLSRVCGSPGGTVVPDRLPVGRCGHRGAGVLALISIGAGATVVIRRRMREPLAN